MTDANDNACGIAPTASKIMDAALALFTEKGISSTTTREIAAAASVNEVTLFRHFGNKESLVDQIVKREMPVSHVPPELFDSLQGDPAEEIPMIVHRIFDMVCARRSWIIMVMRNVHQYPELGQSIDRIRTPVFEAFVRYLDRQVEAGLLCVDNTQVAATMLIGPLISMFTLFESGPGGLIPASVSSKEALSFHLHSYLNYVLVRKDDLSHLSNKDQE